MKNLIPRIETRSRAEIKAYQEEQLEGLLSYLQSNSPYYQELFQKHHIDITTIRRLEDLQKIPVTTKDDLQKRNTDFICVPRTKIVDYITTSGTLGDPVTFVATQNDLDRLAYNEFLSLSTAGGTSEDIYQLMVTLDRRFMAGLAYFLGIKRLGAGVVRAGVGSPAFQLDTIQRIKPSILVAVPSFLVKLIDYAQHNGIDISKTSVKSAVCIGEPIRGDDFQFNALGQRIREKWDIDLYSTYASTEMATAFTECQEGRGGHHHPELIILEVLNEDNQPVEEGQAGEVTITTLGIEGMPLLRFKTGDICHFHTEACSCGRNTLRLGPVMGRKQRMIKYKGTTLYPPALFEVLNSVKAVEDYVVTLNSNDIGVDEISVEIATQDASTHIGELIKDEFRKQVRVVPQISFTSKANIQKLKFPPMARKPVKLIDKRKKAK